MINIMLVKTLRRSSLLFTFLFSWLLSLTLIAGENPVFTEETGQAEKPRIITLAPHIVELLFEIEAGSQIIATTEFSDFPEEAKQIPTIGNYLKLDLERIVALKPDLIIAWRDGNPAGDLAKLQKLGFRIEYSNPKELKDIGIELLWLGEVTDNLKVAAQRAEVFNEGLNKLETEFSGQSDMLVFYELWGNPLTTIGPQSWPAKLLQLCGAKNAFAEVNNDYPQVSIEQVLAKKVDVIIQPLSVNQTDKTGYPWQNWSGIKAVSNEQIIRPDADKIHRMTTRTLQELTILCKEIDKSRQFYDQTNG